MMQSAKESFNKERQEGLTNYFAFFCVVRVKVGEGRLGEEGG